MYSRPNRLGFSLNYSEIAELYLIPTEKHKGTYLINDASMLLRNKAPCVVRDCDSVLCVYGPHWYFGSFCRFCENWF